MVTMTMMYPVVLKLFLSLSKRKMLSFGQRQADSFRHVTFRPASSLEIGSFNSSFITGLKTK